MPGTLSAAEIRVLDAIDEDRLVPHLVDLVRVPSVTGTDAESDLQHAQAAGSTDLRFDVDAWRFDLPALTSHPDFPGTEAEPHEGHGVVGVLGGTGDGAVPALVLQGHADVVPDR